MLNVTHRVWTVYFGCGYDLGVRHYYTDYHAEQFCRAMRMNGTPHALFSPEE